MPRLSLLINLMHSCWIKQYNLWIIVPSNFLRNNQPMVILLFLYKYTNVKMLFLPITYICQPNRKMRIELVVISVPLASPIRIAFMIMTVYKQVFRLPLDKNKQTVPPPNVCDWLSHTLTCHLAGHHTTVQMTNVRKYLAHTKWHTLYWFRLTLMVRDADVLAWRVSVCSYCLLIMAGLISSSRGMCWLWNATHNAGPLWNVLLQANQKQVPWRSSESGEISYLKPSPCFRPVSPPDL